MEVNQRITHRLAADGAWPPGHGRRRQANDQGGVGWGNPNDAFLIHGQRGCTPQVPRNARLSHHLSEERWRSEFPLDPLTLSLSP